MIYSYFIDTIAQKGAIFLTLLDPENSPQEIKSPEIQTQVENICKDGTDAILVGGSIVKKPNFHKFIKTVKSFSTVPVIIFPGDSMQLSEQADAILFLTLLSGRNPDYLIGEQVKATPIIKELELETIPTGYLLIESGNMTSVLYMSHTLPIPRNKPEIAKYHALAAEYLGLKLVYLDAGSGAKNPVPNEMIKEIRDYISIPVFVGGGIRTPEEAKAKIKAGAQGIIIGNTIQKNPELAKDFALAIHYK